MQVLEITVRNKKDSYAQKPAQEEDKPVWYVSARKGTGVLREGNWGSWFRLKGCLVQKRLLQRVDQEFR